MCCSTPFENSVGIVSSSFDLSRFSSRCAHSAFVTLFANNVHLAVARPCAISTDP